jgi:hypothetical protein
VAGWPHACTFVQWSRELAGGTAASTTVLFVVLLIVRCAVWAEQAARARELPDVGFFRAGSGVAPRVTGPRRGFFVAPSGTEGVLLGLVAPWLLPVGVWWVVGI